MIFISNKFSYFELSIQQRIKNVSDKFPEKHHTSF